MRLTISTDDIEIVVTTGENSEVDIDAPLTDEEQQELDDAVAAWTETTWDGPAMDDEREQTAEDIATANRGDYKWE